MKNFLKIVSVYIGAFFFSSARMCGPYLYCYSNMPLFVYRIRDVILELMILYHLKVVRLVSVVEQQLLTFPECLNSPMVDSKVHPAQSLVFCIVLCQLLFVILYTFGHYVVFPLIYGFGLSLWYIHIFIRLVYRLWLHQASS
jgi:hypothetical protein